VSDYTKVLVVIRSCKTPAQNAVAEKVAEAYAANEWRKLFLRPIMSVTYSDTQKVKEMTEELFAENERMLHTIISPAS